MLYYLFDWLNELNFPGAGLFQYVSFRAAMAIILSLMISTIIGRRIIDKLQKMQIGETIRDLGLEGQMSKRGTPTMGGLIIIISILVPVLLCCKLHNVYIILMVVTTIWLGMLGFLDDYIKLKRDKEGLRGKFKIVAQIGLGLIVGLTLYLSPDVMIKENIEVRNADGTLERVTYVAEGVKSTQTTIPFVKNNNLNYESFTSFLGDYAEPAAWILFVVITIFIVTAVSNGSNLTDGLDGLAAGSSAIIGATLGVLAYVSGHIQFAAYLNIMFIPGSEELVIFAAAFIGALIGFLWYNAYPAQVFMGDTGSLTIGGIIAVFAIIIHKELLLPILCGIFFIESLSVMMQVFYFKYTKKRYGEGKRIFKMTPLHHHFQKAGNAGIAAKFQRPIIPLPESKIVTRFWIIGAILAVITLATLKIR
ncbi:phospho-N-acetylmuramoyl-pentapeptide-transferase [Dysgonomonas sp. 25]|uniref:phospho-N-acetylmuramoyl-pentapeptide- transferase n=1 Tax=Dysgonomonas sp. 25 TaxID=2302933 RepID=UPI0013D20179|nr:phospho-N-acetylmuramoyl-pentapeptide-transferase [Dysgonomonas sp. 25]NDV68703.1 phospho-N-acetylmuramoyl-pentapeptide-transferase [Dysgonomonas sp. 25]